MRRLAIAAAILAACGLGFGLAQMVPTTAVPAAATTTIVERADVRGLDEPALRAMIRATIRDELAAGRTPEVESSSDTAREPAAAPTPEQQTERRTADQIVAAALAAGVWRQVDRDAIEALDALDPIERLEAMRPLVIATNARRVRVEVVGPLFL